jgi:hypothetical protein
VSFFCSLLALGDSGSGSKPERVWITDVFIVSPENLDHIEKGSMLIEDGCGVRVWQPIRTNRVGWSRVGVENA